MKKKTKQNLIAILIPAVIIAGVVLAIVFSSYDSGQKLAYEKFLKLNLYSKEEITFLDEQGFLEYAEANGKTPQTKEEAVLLLKSPGLVEQKLNAPDESFEVLATKLDLKNNSYKLAFKLENKSNQSKDFYLIPVSEESQAVFQEINGQISSPAETRSLLMGRDRVSVDSLAELYDVEKHKKELKPELAQAYDDIEKKNYQAKPIKITLGPQSLYIAQSEWKIEGCQTSTFTTSTSTSEGCLTSTKSPVYFLVYGSAGGVKDDLTILNVHSYPQQGENWEVEFTTRGQADLKIIPTDQATIDDDEFVSLTCDGQQREPRILEKDIIFYPDWVCPGTGKVVHFTKKAGQHTLKFIFAGQEKFAYNSPGWTVDGLDYTTRMKLTIEADLIDADLIDLPVLVKLTDARFDWTHSNADGYDIRFTEDDGETLIKYERERHDGANYAEYWVKVPSVSGTVDTDFYMYYRTTDTADGADPTNVWDANMKARFSVKDLTTSTIEDSTTNNNDGTKTTVNEPAEIEGKIAWAQEFDGGDDFINAPTSASLELSSAGTISGWVRYNTTIDYNDRIAVNGQENDFWIGIRAATTKAIVALLYDGAAKTAISTTIAAVDTWYHVAGVFNGTTLCVYVNGAQEDSVAAGAINYEGGDKRLRIGSYAEGGGGYTKGIIDEVRLTNDARTAAEIKADYNSQNDTLLTYGAEEPFPSNSAPTITSVTDYPDPLEAGKTITFSVDWNDADAEGIKMYICKAQDGGTSGCGAGGTWCSYTDTYTTTDPITCTYAVQTADVGTKNYYAYVCDNEPSCSGATSGTFTVGAASSSGMSFGGTGSAGGWTVDSLTYTTRKMLIVDSSKIDANLTDLPVLVKLTSSNFDFSKANSDGYDIRFTDDDGSTLLKYERERHDSGSSLAEYWVKLPSVSATADTIFYMYYRTTDTADGADPTNVWDANYKMVQHLSDLTTSTVNDSTTNNYDGTKTGSGNPAETDGQIGKAQDFSGDEEITCGDINEMDGASKLTMGVWIRIDYMISTPTLPLRKYSAWTSAIEASFEDSWFTARFAVDATNNEGYTADYAFDYGQIYHWVFVFDGTQTGDAARLKIFRNGEQLTLSYEYEIPATAADTGVASFKIGENGAFDGLIDEVRVSNDARTAAEIKADYNSENNTLLGYAPEEKYATGAFRVQGGVRFGD